jgi:hypothetical protein
MNRLRISSLAFSDVTRALQRHLWIFQQVIIREFHTVWEIYAMATDQIRGCPGHPVEGVLRRSDYRSVAR